MHDTPDVLDVEADLLIFLFTFLRAISTRTPWFLSWMCDFGYGRAAEATSGRRQRNPR